MHAGLVSLGNRVCEEKGQVACGYFLSFRIQSDFLSLLPREIVRLKGQLRVKQMHVGVPVSLGCGPASCTVLQGGFLASTLNWDISLPFFLVQEIHVT